MTAFESAALPQTLVTITSIGIALAFWLADRHSPTSRALSLALAAMGLGMFLNANYVQLAATPSPYSGLFAIPEGVAIVAFLEWLLRVRRTVPTRNLDVRGGDGALRLGQLAGLVYVAESLLWPKIRISEFLAASSTGLIGFEQHGFWMFAAPVLVSVVAGGFASLLLFRRKPDVGETLRVLAFLFSTPFFVAGFVLPLSLAALSVLIGLMIMLGGGVQYHVLQGQRGEFMSRFLSPQVAALVSSRGLKAAMQQAHLEITVINCDLRGFTRYAEAHPSQRVIEVLSDYYAEVGKVVAEFGATIKDYAGDGILILVGAPIAVPDHAAVGLKMAGRIRTAGVVITKRWSTRKGKLGIGVGVASGFVTVGIIGSASRLEYTAVGSPVNLSARLCEEAKDQEILIAPRTAELAGVSTLEVRETPVMKGFGQLEQIYAMA